ncbi:MAG: hypothetical protein MI923_29250 [Phycisphaerales bacterium]|nr:hypothetical protein [Phycisphaerales bacterium]
MLASRSRRPTGLSMSRVSGFNSSGISSGAYGSKIDNHLGGGFCRLRRDASGRLNEKPSIQIGDRKVIRELPHLVVRLFRQKPPQITFARRIFARLGFIEDTKQGALIQRDPNAAGHCDCHAAASIISEDPRQSDHILQNKRALLGPKYALETAYKTPALGMAKGARTKPPTSSLLHQSQGRADVRSARNQDWPCKRPCTEGKTGCGARCKV